MVVFQSVIPRCQSHDFILLHPDVVFSSRHFSSAVLRRQFVDEFARTWLNTTSLQSFEGYSVPSPKVRYHLISDPALSHGSGISHFIPRSCPIRRPIPSNFRVTRILPHSTAPCCSYPFSIPFHSTLARRCHIQPQFRFCIPQHKIDLLRIEAARYTVNMFALRCVL